MLWIDTRRIVPTLIAFVALTVAALGLVPTTVRAQDAATQAEADPQAVMVDVAKRLFAALDENRDAIRKDPAAVSPLVARYLLPHFDVEYATQLVLAQYYRTASPEQRQRFFDAFYRALLRAYSGALTDITADRLKVIPFRGESGAPQVTVRTEITRSNGAVVSVDYRLRKTPDGWKAFDVIIAGISYVRNYRTDLGSEIGAKGLDAVILRLESQGALPTGGAAGGR